MKKRQVVVKREYTASSAVGNIRYGECQKNHAANTGGYAVDGCREFMASAGEGTTAALTCVRLAAATGTFTRRKYCTGSTEPDQPVSHSVIHE